MTASMEQRQQFEEEALHNRSRKNELERLFRWVWYGNIALMGYFFVLAMFCGASVSRDPSVEGPYKFYLSMAWGGFEILVAAAIGILSFLAAGKRRTPHLLLIGCFVAQIAMILFSSKTYLPFGNIAGDVLGLGLNIYAYRLQRDWAALQELPGWPLFLGEKAFPAKYELPAYVQRHPASGEMDGIGAAEPPAAAPVAAMPTSDSQLLTDSVNAAWLQSQTDSLSDRFGERIFDAEAPVMTDGIAPIAEPIAQQNTHAQWQPPPTVLQTGPDIAVLSPGTPAPAAAVSPSVPASTDPLPELSAMTAAHAAETVAEAASNLPDPADVIARLRAMRAERTGEE